MDLDIHSHNSSYLLFDREAKIKCIQQTVKKKLNFNKQNHETRSLSLNAHKTQLQMGQSPQHRPDTLKLLEDKVECTH